MTDLQIVKISCAVQRDCAPALSLIGTGYEPQVGVSGHDGIGIPGRVHALTIDGVSPVMRGDVDGIRALDESHAVNVAEA